MIPSKPGAVNVAPNSAREETNNNRPKDYTNSPIIDGPYTGSIDSDNTMKDGSEIAMNENEDIANIPLAAEVYEERSVPLAHATELRRFSFKKKCLIVLAYHK